MVYKQTVFGTLRILQETLFLAIALLIGYYLLPQSSLASEPILIPSLIVAVILWVLIAFVIDPEMYPTFSSDQVDIDYLDISEDESWRESIRKYASGHVHTKLYMFSKLYLIGVRTIIIGSVLALIAIIYGPMYVAWLIILYTLLPMIYSWKVSNSEVTGLRSIHTEINVDIDSFDALIAHLSDFFNVEKPRLHVTETSKDTLYVVKSLISDSTIVFSPQMVQNINKGDPDLDMSDRFKLAHEFAHLSIGTKYMVYSQVSIIALGLIYFLAIASIDFSPAIIMVISTVFVLGVRLVMNYIKRIEEFESDKLAAEFIKASSKDCVFALVSVTNSDENPFTYPHNSVLGKVYTLFIPHPPIVSRIEKLLEQRS